MKVSGQLHAPAALLPGKERPVPIGFLTSSWMQFSFLTVVPKQWLCHILKKTY